MNFRFLPVFLCCLLPALSSAQDQAQLDLTNTLLGYWEGAFIKGNSYQKLEMEVFLVDNKPMVRQIMEEWFPNYGDLELPVTVDSSGIIRMPSGYGPVTLQLDPDALELIGQVADSAPAVYVHLKKKPVPPATPYSIEAVTIPNGKVQLAGHLHLPEFPQTETAIIIVGGRGCYAAATEYDLYARFFRSYGVTTLVYQKRGNGASTGDCAKATIDDLASDLRAAYQFLKQHPRHFKKIGVLGSSAGGWVALKAQEAGSFDFTISVVGPATSVFDQQMQSARVGAKVFDLSKEALGELEAYTKLVFEAPASRKTLKSMEQLLAKAEEHDWLPLLEDTDMAQKVKDIDRLWVRRHQFDPETVLQLYDKPFLGLYGENDWIVPARENIAHLEKAFDGERRFLLHTFTFPEADHGMETKAEYRVLESEASYWHFYRASPQLFIRIVEFMEAFALLE